MESQVTLLFWPCLSLTEKQCTINHMIIFNDSISKFYQFSFWGFCRGISVFLVSASVKKMLRQLDSLKKISIVSLNKKVILVFHTIFKLDFITQIIYCIIYVCILFWYFFCSLISVSKKRNIETMLTFPYSYNWQKLTTKSMKKEARSIWVWTLNM